MEKNQQILFTICVQPNLMIDWDYFIWIAVIEDQSVWSFQEKKRGVPEPGRVEPDSPGLV